VATVEHVLAKLVIKAQELADASRTMAVKEEKENNAPLRAQYYFGREYAFLMMMALIQGKLEQVPIILQRAPADPVGEVTPIPYRPGWKRDQTGAEYYSSAWLGE
jgi:hypothetical protein